MRKLALASLRYRLPAFIATFVAVLIGGSLLIACAGLFETAIRMDTTPQRLAGAPVVVTGPAGFKVPDEQYQTVGYTERSGVDRAAVREIRGVSGVAEAVPDVSFTAVALSGGRPVTGGGSVLSGHGWDSAALTPYTLRAGLPPTAAGQVVLDARTAGALGAKPGSRVELAVNGQPGNFTVSGVARSSGEVRAAAMFFSAADTERAFARPDTVDAIGVFPVAGTSADELAERIGARFPGLSALTGNERGAAEFLGIDASQLPLFLMAGVFTGMVAVVMALVVSATISLAVRQRMPELALLRSIGATPKQVHKMVITETMLVSFVAALGALVLGKFAGDLVYSVSTSGGVLPAGLDVERGLPSFAGGFLLTLLVPWVAAQFAGLSAAKAKPVAVLADATIPAVRVHPLRRLLAKLCALAMIGCSIATLFLDAETASLVGGQAALTGAIAVFLAGPELVDWLIVRSGGFIKRFAKQHGPLAVINTRVRAVQFAAVLTPVTLAVAIALGNIYTQTTQDEGIREGYLNQFTVDAVVGSTTGAVTPGMLDAARHTPGAASASPLVTSQGWLEQPYDSWNGSEYVPLVGLDAQGRNGVYTTEVTAGSLGGLSGNAVALPESKADGLAIEVGDTVRMRLGDGASVPVEVVALVDSPADYAPILLPAALLAPHTSAGTPTQILVRGDGDSAALVAALRQRLHGWQASSVSDAEGLAEALPFVGGTDFQALILYLTALLAIAYAAIASVNTLAVAILSRRREFAVQRLAGATRRQVAGMLFVEGGIIAVAGSALGVLIAAIAVVPMGVAVGTILPSGPVWVLLGTVFAVFAIVLPVTYFAGKLAMKHKPIEAVTGPAS